MIQKQHKTMLAAVIAACGVFATTSAYSAVLIAGFHDGDALAADGTGSQFTGNAQAQSPTLSDVAVTLSSTLNLTTAHYSQITFTTWGTTALDVVVPDSSGLNKSIMSSAAAFTLTMTVTNNNAQDLSLDQIHFAVKTDGATAVGKDYTIGYIGGGALGAGSLNLNSTITGGVNGYDLSLGAGGLGLTDTTLSTGESAQFTWSTVASDHGIRFDNLAISGTEVSAVPEASTAALIGLAGLALIARRRR